ncbi:MAG: DNA methyltransferase [Candidatus Hodarchaeota archaeon]
MNIFNAHWIPKDLSLPLTQLELIERHLPSVSLPNPSLPSIDSTWSNLLIQGDNLPVLNTLQAHFMKKIKFVYIDPPYFVGTNEVMHIPITVYRPDSVSPPPLQKLVYQNTLNESDPVSAFCKWFYQRLQLIKSLICDDGFIATRFDYHYSHYVKILLDNIFGSQNFINEFIIRRMKKNLSKKQVRNQNHVIVHSDSIFLYQLSNKSTIHTPITKVKRKNAQPAEIANHWDNIWVDIPGYEKSKKTLYPTENSEILLKRLISLCTTAGDLLADFFCGSGTTVAVAERLDRRWIGVDLSQYSLYEIRKRLLHNGLKHPLALYRLIYKEESKKKNLPISSPALNFKICDKSILQAFGGVPLKESSPFQGKKDENYIYIGKHEQVISETDIESLNRFLKQEKDPEAELIILGWKFRFDLPFFINLHQKTKHKIYLIRIHKSPNTYSFNPLPSIDIRWKVISESYQVHLSINSYYLSDEETNSLNLPQTPHSLDFIDYWAVNWDSEHKKTVDWYSFRKLGSGRKIVRGINRETAWRYSKAGKYTILINIVDIVGNDLHFTIYFEFQKD